MGKGNFSVVFMALMLAAIAFVGNCQPLVPKVRQAEVSSRIPLYCSNPSPPPIGSAAILSGARVSISCEGVTNTTATDSTGNYEFLLNFPNAIDAATITSNCPVIVTIPANCTIRSFTGGPPVRTLQSTPALGSFDFFTNSGFATFQTYFFTG